MNQKGFAPVIIIIIIIIILIALVAGLGGYLAYLRFQPKDALQNQNWANPSEAFHRDIFVVEFKEGADIKAFAKRHNISTDNMEPTNIERRYYIKHPAVPDFTTVIEKFRQDPDVKEARPLQMPKLSGF